MPNRKKYANDDERKAAKAQRERARRAQMSEEQRNALRDTHAANERARRSQLSEEERNDARSRDAARHNRTRSEFLEEERNAYNQGQIERRLRQRQTRARQTMCMALSNHVGVNEDDVPEHSCGLLDQKCTHCHSLNFLGERTQDKQFNCCQKGKVRLSLPEYPDELKNLLTNKDPKSKHFLDNIRKYNSALACASMGAKIQFPPGHGPYCFRIHGQVYHNSGPLHGRDGEQRQFAQIYILDPDEAAEQRMRITANSGCEHDLMLRLSRIMHEKNKYAQAYKMMYEVEKEEEIKAKAEGRQPVEISMALINDRTKDLRRYNAPRFNEVAVVFESGDGAPPFNRDFQVQLRSHDGVSSLKHISILHSGLDPMTYPLLMPCAEAGWTIDMMQSGNGRRMTQLQYYKYFLSEREEFNQIFYAGKLAQQYIVDAYSKIEANRLHYIEEHQKELRCESYTALNDYIDNRAENEGLKVGKKVVLPSSFAGSPRAMNMHYQDAVAIIRKFGKPDIFVTMTCNAQWKEITENLKDGQRSEFRPDLVSRVFDLKLDALIDDLTRHHILGECIAHVYVIEFQKRGLPHAHILIVLKSEFKPKTSEIVDQIVSAEIPDPETHPRLHAYVLKHMIHGPCGKQNLASPCMGDGKCTKDYPKAFNPVTNPSVNGYPLYQRSNTGKTYRVGKHQVDNTWVVPYNPFLMLKYNCHTNVEVCASIKSVKYLFKYVYKGHDCATVDIRNKDDSGVLVHNEVKSFLDARYVSSPEAIWRIFAFNMHKQSHSVEKLPVHLPQEQMVYFQEGDHTDALIDGERDDRLTAWFKLNQEDENARQYLYHEIPEKYTYISKSKTTDRERFWKPRKAGMKKIGRIYTVSIRQGELYYLRMLLLHVRGPTSFEDVRTAEGEVYPTYKEAAAARNLLAEDTEWHNALEEATVFKMPYQIRQMFAFICAFCEPKNALTLWQNHKEAMTEDFTHRGLDTTQAEYQALFDIQETLAMATKKLSDYGLPEPPQGVQSLSLDNEIDYDAAAQKAAELTENLNEDYQRPAFDQIMSAIKDDDYPDRLFFLDGPGGSGKTYTYEALYYSCTAEHISVNCSSTTGVSATLLPRGGTYHSTFKVPVPLLENSTSSIRPNSQAAKLLREIKAFVIDEVTMMPHVALAVIDTLLRDVMNNHKPFGGKVILLGGDFRQILPVVKKGNRVKIVQASIKMGKLWPLFKCLKLRKNMRLAPGQEQHQEWLLKLGEGVLTNDANLGEDIIEIPPEFVELGDLVDSIFGKSIKVKDVKEKYAHRGILSPLNEHVMELNKQILARLEGEERTYMSVDSVESEVESDQITYSPEILHSMTPSGMPPHELKLKVGAIIMLLRNLNSRRGLCNGTRLIVKSMQNNFITAEVITGKAAGQTLFIPRIDLSPSDADMPFQLKRRQFPVMLAFAMTINKSQGQSLDELGIYLPDPVFSHGQLYVAFSRGRDKAKIKVKIFNTLTQGQLIKRSHRVFTRNVVYKEIFDMDQRQPINEQPEQSNSDSMMEVDIDEDMEIDWELPFAENGWPEPMDVDQRTSDSDLI